MVVYLITNAYCGFRHRNICEQVSTSFEASTFVFFPRYGELYVFKRRTDHSFLIHIFGYDGV